MGCINSSTTKGLNELRSSSAVGAGAGAGVGGGGSGSGGAALESIGLGAFYDNVYRVRAVRLMAEGIENENGFLELTTREIIFVPLNDNNYPTSMVWNLQHLRRYGASGDTFSFEAGRRCMSGAGVFTFQLEEAEVLYRLFQRYINSVGLNTEEMQHLQAEYAGNALARLHVNTNNYLHPNLAQNSAASAAAAAVTAACENIPEAPDSPSIISNANEAVLFAHNSRYTPHTLSNAAVEQFGGGNIYCERSMSACNEQNNNINSFVGMNDQSELSICGESGTASAFSTISRKLLITRSSQDNTTNNSQAMTPTTPLRLYANVDNFADFTASNNSDSCYENVRGSDFPLLFPPITQVGGGVPTVVGGSNPTTPGANYTTNASALKRMASIADPECMSLGSGGEAGASLVNYIVLDLDQPRSPVTPFGSEFSISVANTEPDETALATTTIATTTTTLTTTTTTTTTAAPATNATTFAMTTTNTHIEKSVAEEQQLDYSTIDFVKTWALIESSTDGVNFDVDPDPDTAEEELRITRHSKCVRKAYSISE